jgi:hypothetical protein
MATEKQCAFFEKLYTEECAREASLNAYSAGLLSLITLYSGLMLFVAEHGSSVRIETTPAKLFFLLALMSMVIGFLFAMLARQLAKYEALNDPDSVIAQYGDEPMLDSEFFDNRIADYRAAIVANTAVNNGKAFWLERATVCLGLSIFFHALIFVFAIL